MIERLNSKQKKICLLLLFILYFGMAYFIMGRLGIPCVFKVLFGIPCPGCGMTRALFALLRGDLAAAFKYNAVIFLMPYVFWYLFFGSKRRIHKILLLTVALVATVNWVIHIIFYIGG